MALSPLHCIELSMIGEGVHENPLTVLLRHGQVEFEVFETFGERAAETRIHGAYGALGLEVGAQLDIRLVDLKNIGRVAVKLIHGESRVLALRDSLILDSRALDATDDVPRLMVLTGKGIDQVRIVPTQDQTALLEICVGSRR